MKKFDVAIIGAGSVGLPLSYYLAKRGLKVGVIEKLSSVGRGQNRAAIGGIRATHSDPAKITLCQMSLEIFRNFEHEYGFDIDWVQGGYMYPVFDEAKEKALKELLVKQKSYNLNIDWVGPEKIAELAPGISTEGLRGGTFSPGDGNASNLKVAESYYVMAMRAGVEFFFNEEVVSMEKEGRVITKFATDKDEYSAGLVVNASGADATALGRLVGLELPVFPDSHEAGITEPVQKFFDPMIVDIGPDYGSLNYYFYQNKEGQVVFCITPMPKIEGHDSDNTSSFLPHIISRMLTIYPRLRNLRVRRTWRGLYPMTPDGFPIVGYTNEFDNLLLTVGMCGQGFMLGPGLGKVLTEIIVDKSTAYNHILDQLTLYRSFAGQEVLK